MTPKKRTVKIVHKAPVIPPPPEHPLFVATNPNENYFLRRITTDGKYEMGFCPVMFGFRVRAGHTGESTVVLDWCGGDVFQRLQWLYAVCLGCLDHLPMEKLPPFSDPKPFYNDMGFMKRVIDASVGYEKYLNLFTLDEFEKSYLEHKLLFRNPRT